MPGSPTPTLVGIPTEEYEARLPQGQGRPRDILAITAYCGGLFMSDCFYAHRSVLRQYSRAFSGSYSITARFFDLQGNRALWYIEPMMINSDPDTFTLYIVWCYHQTIPGVNGKWDLGRLVDLWLLAEFFETPKLQNHVMDHILRKPLESYRVSSFVIRNIFNRTEHGTPLRRMLAEGIRHGRLRLGADSADYRQIHMPSLVQIFVAIANHTPRSLMVDEEGFGEGELDEAVLNELKIEVELNWGLRV